MKKLMLLFTLIFCQLSFAYVEERNTDFTVSPSLMSEGKIQVGFKWVSPNSFSNSRLFIMDVPKIHNTHAGNNQLIISKVAFESRKSFSQLSHNSMNNAAFISKMLNSVAISQKSSQLWNVTNKVSAYGIPFKVNFDVEFKEVPATSLSSSIVRYFRDEASGISGTGKERFLVLDMTRFSQLMYRNYSIVYVKEISANRSFVISTLIAGFDINAANSFFNFPPFSSTKSTMIGNLRTQILQMAQNIQ